MRRWPTALLNIDLVAWRFGAPKLFRYFDVEEHADSFTGGRCYISTLRRCRETEDAIRADPGEGMLSYQTGTISGSSSDPLVREIGRRGGIHVAGDGAVTISNTEHRLVIPDAYVLCLSDTLSDVLLKKFGPYVVEIDTLRFFENLTYALSTHYELEREAPLRKVAYTSRSYAGLDPSPGVIGFTKPESFRDESEVRCIWLPQNHTPAPQVFHAAGVAGLSKRIR